MAELAPCRAWYGVSVKCPVGREAAGMTERRADRAAAREGIFIRETHILRINMGRLQSIP